MNAFLVYMFKFKPYGILTSETTDWSCPKNPNFKDTLYFLACMRKLLNRTYS